MEVGQIIEGNVTGITNFGAFISFDEGKSGLCHISEVSVNYVKDIHDVLKVGDKVKAKITKIDEKNKISLSIKQALPKPEPKPRVFAPAPEKNLSFEEKLSKFMKDSEEKQAEFKRATDAKRGGRGTYRG